MANWVQARTDEMLDTLPEVQQALEAGAILVAIEQAKQAFKTTTGKEPSDAEIEALMATLQAARQPQVRVPTQTPRRIPIISPVPQSVPSDGNHNALPN